MSEKNQFIVIEEKPKRGYERYTPNRVWIGVMCVLGATFFLGLGIVVAVALDSNLAPLEIELVGTSWGINSTAELQLTQTNSAIETFLASTPAALRTLISVYFYQTPLAATQSALETAGAQAAATLTAVAPGSP